MGYWKAGITSSSLAVLAACSVGQSSTTVFDVEQLTSQGYYRSNSSILSYSQLNNQPAARISFGGLWSQIGVNYASPQNWSTYDGFRMTFKNEETRPVTIGVQWDVSGTTAPAVGAPITLRPLETRTIFLDFTGITPDQHGIHAPIPALTDYYSHQYPATPNVATHTVHKFQVYSKESAPARVSLTSVKAVVTDSSITAFVDVFGQLSRRSWSWKVSSAQQIRDAHDDELAELAANPGKGEELGSSTLPTTPYMGKWRVVRTQSGKAYFLSPTGKYFWSLGLCQVIPAPATITQNREYMFAMLPPEGTPKAQFYSTTTKNGASVKTYSHYAGNIYDKYGEEWPTKYRQHAATRMRSWGFNTVGTASSVWDMANQGLPFTVTLTTADYPTRLTTPFAYWRSLPDPFGADFPAWLQANLASQLGNLKNNPNLLGVFVDGENSWGMRTGTTRERYQVPLSALAAPASQPAKQAFVNHIFVKYRTIEALNQAWGTNFASWHTMRTTTVTLTDPQVELASPDFTAFLFNYVKVYAFRVRQAVKSLNQDILWLGTREFMAWAPNEVFSALQHYADTISVTHYDRSEDVPWNYFNALKRPVLISEFTFAAREGNSMSQLILQRCETSTQAGRAALAASYLDKALTSKNVIGCHWFTYIDQPISGKFNGENNAFGLVDVTDRPYTEMVSMFRSVSNTMYSRRGL